MRTLRSGLARVAVLLRSKCRYGKRSLASYSSVYSSFGVCELLLRVACAWLWEGGWDG